MGEIVVLRHAETAWSVEDRFSGWTDLPLTTRGEVQALALRPAIGARRFLLALVSPLSRTRRTGELAGLQALQVDEDLAPWDYGAYEGRTPAEVLGSRTGWSLWVDGVPAGPTPGEAAEQVGWRCDRVLARVRPLLASGDVVLVGHSHQLRVLAARWLGLPAAAGQLFRLDTAARGVLSAEYGHPVLARWNDPPPSAG